MVKRLRSVVVALGLLLALASSAHAQIAYDNSADGGLVNPGTSVSWAQTLSGSNLGAYVCAFGDTVNTDPTGTKITGATSSIDGALTLASKISENNGQTGGRWVYAFRLIPASVGNHTFTVNASSSIALAGMSASYTGVMSASQPDVTSTGFDAVNNITLATSLTTTTDKDWAILCSKNANGTATSSDGTVRQTNADGLSLTDTGGAVTPAGSKTLTNTTALSTSWGSVMEAFKPTAGGASGCPLTLCGGGPGQ